MATHVLIFIINGEDVAVDVLFADSLASAKELALQASHNTGRPSAEWEVRNEKGYLLDQTATLTALELQNNERLFVTLQVGHGG
jgi:hypothetical protein